MSKTAVLSWIAGDARREVSMMMKAWYRRVRSAVRGRDVPAGRRLGVRLPAVAAVMTVGVVGLIAPSANSRGRMSKPTTAALNLTYGGSDPAFLGVYQIGDPFLPPGVRVQPLMSGKTAAALSVSAIEASGLDDHVGAVGFSSEADWVEPLTTNYDSVRARLLGTTAGAGSNLDAGMQAAEDELTSFRARAHAAKTMVIITDGRTDENAALDQAREAAAEGITIHVIGIGCNVNVDLLRQIAAIGGGVSLFVNDDDPAVYGPQINAMLESIAVKQVEIALVQ